MKEAANLKRSPPFSLFTNNGDDAAANHSGGRDTNRSGGRDRRDDPTHARVRGRL